MSQRRARQLERGKKKAKIIISTLTDIKGRMSPVFWEIWVLVGISVDSWDYFGKMANGWDCLSQFSFFIEVDLAIILAAFNITFSIVETNCICCYKLWHVTKL